MKIQAEELKGGKGLQQADEDPSGEVKGGKGLPSSR
jgi:hypothetical protein